VSNTEIVMPKLFWPMDKFMLEGEDVGSIVRWIGHDAQIFGGNSGGPLVNLKGEIVGINEIKLGLRGAIPGNLAREVAEKLIKFGKVSRSWFGLEIQPLLRHSGMERGVLVSGTIQGSPSEKAGFLPGDILTKLAGREVNVRFSEEIPIFNQFAMGLPVGEEVEAVVLRQDMELVLRMTSEERENVEAKKAELKQWGITASNISLLAAKEMRRENQDGVLVTSVRPGGPCWEAKPRISDGDVIIEVNGVAIKNTEQLLERTNKSMKENTAPLLVEVAFDRKKERYLTVLKLDTEKEIHNHGFEVRKAWLPVAVQAITGDVAERLGIEKLTGVRITRVFSSSSAERAGLKVGDLIISVDGETVRTSSAEDVETLPAIIREYKIGSTVELVILRGKEKIEVAVALEQ